jgi:hypothetical protein
MNDGERKFPRQERRTALQSDLKKMRFEREKCRPWIAQMERLMDSEHPMLRAWCPWCDTEMISAKARWWWSMAERCTYLECPDCKRRSRWVFHDGARTEYCLDVPPEGRQRPG